ncbi:hypothetical protein [Kribbella sp. NPDC050470]|uniref:hypothetical protein n=1 Tax=unclassified Kribbella TaxID=2644121 RepID=UPI0037893918
MAIPEGYTTVTPWIIGQDTDGLMDWLTRAFGAEEIDRMVGPDGRIGHAEMRIGNAIVMMFDAGRSGRRHRRSCGSTSTTRRPCTRRRSRRAARR